jgi:transcription elongation factor GreA
MEASDQVLTIEGRERLRAELDQLRRDRRPEILERLSAAREVGVWDSPDHRSARDELGFVDGRIAWLEKVLSEATVLPAPPTRRATTVALGVTVTVRDEEGAEERYAIVGPAEANPGEGRISDQSPVGRALVGHRRGETVTAETPGGARRLTIVAIR